MSINQKQITQSHRCKIESVLWFYLAFANSLCSRCPYALETMFAASM